MDLSQKPAFLHDTLVSLGSVLVAYSGGADSGYLAYAAHRARGDRMLAVIADSPSLPRKELAAALDDITAALRSCGFTYIALDTQGYRSGSMNDALPTSALIMPK